MVAMPYILVGIVLDQLALIFFSITSGALLSGYPLANLYLPAKLRNRRTLAAIAQGLFVLLLSTIVVRSMAGISNAYIYLQFLYEFFFYVGFLNSVVLVYQFLNRRYFLHRPKAQRRLLIALLSLVMTTVSVIAVIAAVVVLFVIK